MIFAAKKSQRQISAACKKAGSKNSRIFLRFSVSKSRGIHGCLFLTTVLKNLYMLSGQGIA